LGKPPILGPKAFLPFKRGQNSFPGPPSSLPPNFAAFLLHHSLGSGSSPPTLGGQLPFSRRHFHSSFPPLSCGLFHTFLSVTFPVQPLFIARRHYSPFSKGFPLMTQGAPTLYGGYEVPPVANKVGARKRALFSPRWRRFSSPKQGHGHRRDTLPGRGQSLCKNAAKPSGRNSPGSYKSPRASPPKIMREDPFAHAW